MEVQLNSTLFFYFEKIQIGAMEESQLLARELANARIRLFRKGALLGILVGITNEDTGRYAQLLALSNDLNSLPQEHIISYLRVAASWIKS